MRAIVRYITFACSSYHVVRTNFKDHWRFLNADVPCTRCPHTDLYGVHTEKVRCVRIYGVSVATLLFGGKGGSRGERGVHIFVRHCVCNTRLQPLF